MLSERQLFLRHLAQTSDAPLLLSFKKAKGVYMFDKNGNKCIDLISGIGVSNLGHCHPNIVRAVKKQSENYMHLMVYGEFVQSPQVQLGYQLANTLPENLNTVYLTNSGAEAIEGAMKLAKRYTGRSELISFTNAYHGSTQGALSLCGNERFKAAFRPLLPDVRVIRYNCPEDLSYITHRSAAVFAETVQAEAGVILPQEDYLRALRAKCNETRTLLVFDEIQTGFGRTGKFWGFQHERIIPDIITCAKGMGGGMPIGAFISTDKLMAVFKESPVLGHITTFGGHPVSSAAALATLTTIRQESLLEKVEKKALLFKKYLKHPKIKAIRHCGLLMAVEFDSFGQLKNIIDKAAALGVLTDWFLFCDYAMRIAPPLIITEEQIQEACEKILQAINYSVQL